MLMNAVITKQPRECEPGYLLGTMLINNTYHHIECIRVVDIDGIFEAWVPSEGENYNKERLEGIYRFIEGALMSTEIHGHEGEWVIYTTPYCD